eukprot:834731-Pyramimonas_sp.AAC.1
MRPARVRGALCNAPTRRARSPAGWSLYCPQSGRRHVSLGTQVAPKLLSIRFLTDRVACARPRVGTPCNARASSID